MKQYNLLELREKLLEIDSLTDKEREIVLDELKKYYKDRKITYMELYNTIIKLRKEYKISDVDEKYLRKLLEDLK